VALLDSLGRSDPIKRHFPFPTTLTSALHGR